MPAATIYVVDHHDIVREGLSSLIDRQDDLSIVGGSASAITAMQELAVLTPDVVVVDDALPEEPGQQLAERIIRERIAHRVVVLVASQAPMSSGPITTFPKSGQPEALVSAIRAALAWGEDANAMAATRSPAAYLPPHLLRILGGLAEGLSARQIAEQHGLSLHTVKTYLRDLYSALGTNNRAHTVAMGIRLGLLP